MVKLLLITVLLLPSVCWSDKGINILKLVQVVTRHGDRSPLQTFPKDLYNMSVWQQFGAMTYNQLTWKGMEQHYQLGQFFKKRYIDNEELHLLGPKYDPREIYVRSTDIDRTLMSAYSNLAGMFPPTGNMSPWNVNHTLNWQPIPVHTVTNNLDSLLNPDSDCPYAERLYSREQETAEFKSQSAKYKDLLMKMSEWSGVPNESLVTLWKVSDTLSCEHAHGLRLPNWTQELWPPGNKDNKTVYDTLMYLRAWELAVHFGAPREKAKIRGGPLLKQMVTNMNKTINKSDTMTKFYFYSAHDNTLTAFMKALQVFNYIQPPYASAIVVELYQNNVTNQYTVILLYKNETTTFYNLTLPGCVTNCPYQKFVQLTADMIPSNWTELCKIPDKSENNEALVIGLGIGAGILLLLVMIGIVYIIRKKRGDIRFADYYQVDEE